MSLLIPLSRIYHQLAPLAGLGALGGAAKGWSSGHATGGREEQHKALGELMYRMTFFRGSRRADGGVFLLLSGHPQRIDVAECRAFQGGKKLVSILHHLRRGLRRDKLARNAWRSERKAPSKSHSGAAMEAVQQLGRSDRSNQVRQGA